MRSEAKTLTLTMYNTVCLRNKILYILVEDVLVLNSKVTWKAVEKLVWPVKDPCPLA